MSNNSSENRGPYIDASLWTLQSLAAVFLGLRIYCKLCRHRGLWFDDYFLIAAWLLLAASAGCTSTSVALGFGHHFADFDPANLEKYGIFSILSGFFSVLSSVFSKTSFAITLLRLTQGWLRRVVWGIIISLNVLMPMSALFLFVSCDPPAKNWKPDLPGKCWPSQVTIIYGIAVGAYSSGCDLALALLPWRILMRFRMYRREKIGVAVAMSMGVFATGTGIAKCVTLPLLASPDFTYDGTPFVVWGFAECAVTIMAASIPALRVLVNEMCGTNHFMQHMISSLHLSRATRTTRVSKPPREDAHSSNTLSRSTPSDQSNGRADSLRGDSSIGLALTKSEPDAEVVVVESEGSDPLHEHDMELGDRRHSYSLQNLSG